MLRELQAIRYILAAALQPCVSSGLPIPLASVYKYVSNMPIRIAHRRFQIRGAEVLDSEEIKWGRFLTRLLKRVIFHQQTLPFGI